MPFSARPADHLALKSPVAYGMDDPRLVFFGAYVPEPKDGMTARWFRQKGQVQMVRGRLLRSLWRSIWGRDLRHLREA